MAGRGTDIKLSQVKAAGGLAIVGTERFSSMLTDSYGIVLVVKVVGGFTILCFFKIFNASLVRIKLQKSDRC
jgi:hypothetical protein